MFTVNNIRILKVLVCLSIVVVSGCATDISSNSYSDDSVGEVASTEAAVVLNVRTVKVGPDQLGKSHVGIIAGGVGGALLGSQVSSGIAGGVATLGLAGAGAVGGAMAERSLKTQSGLEITVKLDNGKLRTLVQGSDVSFKNGEHVLLLVYAEGRSKVVKLNDDAQVNSTSQNARISLPARI
jgi:outer membrane lipoprotein SlyB